MDDGYRLVLYAGHFDIVGQLKAFLDVRVDVLQVAEEIWGENFSVVFGFFLYFSGRQLDWLGFLNVVLLRTLGGFTGARWSEQGSMISVRGRMLRKLWPRSRRSGGGVRLLWGLEVSWEGSCLVQGWFELLLFQQFLLDSFLLLLPDAELGSGGGFIGSFNRATYMNLYIIHY